MSKKTHYKTVFISDLHLGTKYCKDELLNNFLSSFKCDTLYLNGDILDVWNLSKKNSYFPQDHVNIIRKLLSKAKNGTQIKYVIGNHDDFLRKYHDLLSTFGNIEIADEFIFTSVLGNKYLVTHGDLYDQIILCHKWLAYTGDALYNWIVDINTVYNRVRSHLGLNYWSFAGFLKTKVKSALEFIYAFEVAVVHEAKRRGLHGCIVGHIHVPQDKELNGLHYLNCGCWTENCTAIVEHFDGTIELITWDTNNGHSTDTEHPD